MKKLAQIVTAIACVGATFTLASHQALAAEDKSVLPNNVVALSNETPESYTIEERPTTFTVNPNAQADNSLAGGDSCRYMLGFTSWDCGTDQPDAWTEQKIGGTIATIVLNISTDIAVLAAYLALAYVLFGGYQFLFSAGDIAGAVRARQTLTRAFTGLAIVLLAGVIFNSIRIGLLANNQSDIVQIGGDGGSSIEVRMGTTDPGIMVTSMISWVVGIAGVVALGFMVYGGIVFMTASGEPNKVALAKKVMLYAAIGLIVVGLAEAITGFVSSKINEAKANTSGEVSLVIESGVKG